MCIVFLHELPPCIYLVLFSRFNSISQASHSVFSMTGLHLWFTWVSFFPRNIYINVHCVIQVSTFNSQHENRHTWQHDISWFPGDLKNIQKFFRLVFDVALMTWLANPLCYYCTCVIRFLSIVVLHSQWSQVYRDKILTWLYIIITHFTGK